MRYWMGYTLWWLFLGWFESDWSKWWWLGDYPLVFCLWKPWSIEIDDKHCVDLPCLKHDIFNSYVKSNHRVSVKSAGLSAAKEAVKIGEYSIHQWGGPFRYSNMACFVIPYYPLSLRKTKTDPFIWSGSRHCSVISCKHSYWGLVFHIYIHMGASQNRRSGTSSGTTPVPYPRSLPPFHTSLKDPFHTSVPYLWSIRYDIYVCIYIYIYTWICAVWFYICTRVLERTYIHECVHARIGLLCPSPVIVLASLCLQRLLSDGRDVLGCCQLAV